MERAYRRRPTGIQYSRTQIVIRRVIFTYDNNFLQQTASGGNTVMVDPFFESQENHTLIGVANVFLEVLFHDVKLDYHVPIISQQGEVDIEKFRNFLKKFLKKVFL